MHSSPVISLPLLYGFLLVLARIAGIFIFLPLPGFKAGPDAAKVVLSLALTFALYSRWPTVQPAPASMLQLTGWALMEAGIGLATGLAVAFMIETLLVAAQAISTQAGFSFASMIDPNTEADSTVLVQIAQLAAGLLFFALGLDRRLLSILSASLSAHPPGTFAMSQPSVEALVMLGSGVFNTGLRLVLPLMTLLFLIDLSIGLLGRVNSQLQMIAIAFPVKMLVSMGVLSFLLLLAPKLFLQSANSAFGALEKVLGF